MQAQTDTDIGALICEAIRSRRLLRFRYDGHERVVQPHTYGLDTTGQAGLCGYQVSGGSRSGASQGWKTFRIDKLSDGALLQQRFHGPRPEYQHNDPGFPTIWAQL